MMFVSQPVSHPAIAAPANPVAELHALRQCLHVSHVGSGLHVPSELGLAQRFHVTRDWRALRGKCSSTQARAWAASDAARALIGSMADAEKARLLTQVRAERRVVDFILVDRVGGCPDVLVVRVDLRNLKRGKGKI